MSLVSPASRRTLSPRIAYPLAASVIGIALLASGTPSPLYPAYSALWGLSPLVLTLVYAIYAVGVVTALLVAGRLSDQVGRRPVLIGALGALIVATVLFMAAESVIWLFAARALQGVATGMALAAASAALLDLHPRRDPAGAGLANGVVSAGGMAVGVIASAAVVQLVPDPRVLAYVIQLMLFAVALALTTRMPEPVTRRTRPRLVLQRPSVPGPTRRAFALAALSVLASWSMVGLFLSLGPQLAADVLHSSAALVGGAVLFTFVAPAAVAQAVLARMAPWTAAAGGATVLAIGVAAIVVASLTDSGVLLLAGAAFGGAGFGLAFLGALRTLTAAMPATHRAEVMASFYLVAYASLSVPAIVAGILVTPLGARETFEIFGVISAVLALAAAAQAWRLRPRPALETIAECPAGAAA